MLYAQTAPTPLPAAVQVGTQIPALTHEEAKHMAAEELHRFIALIETLQGDDWTQPTACTLWNVKDIVAHQAAHVISFTSFRANLAQFNPVMLRPYFKKGMQFLDAWNQAQVDMRRNHTPSQVIAEIRDNAKRSLIGRERIPAFLLDPTLPIPGMDQPRSMRYLFDVIYTRDMWMHRLDICRATGRIMPVDSEHDRRMVALIMLDLAQKAETGLGGRSAVLRLTGAAGGTYHIGANTIPTTVIEIDTLTLCILTSGRSKATDVLAGDDTLISGDLDFGKEVVQFCENRVLY